MRELSEKIRELHGLPANWEVYSVECMPPGERNSTHVLLVGAEARPLKSGPRKGQLTWPNNGKNGMRSFLLPMAEYHEMVN